MSNGTVHPPELRKAAFVGGLIGGAVGTITIQLICFWFYHMHQIPVQ